jgi:hypothetical protein
LEISGNAFMGHPGKDINLKVHFSLDVLVLFHIFKLYYRWHGFLTEFYILPLPNLS